MFWVKWMLKVDYIIPRGVLNYDLDFVKTTQSILFCQSLRSRVFVKTNHFCLKTSTCKHDIHVNGRPNKPYTLFKRRWSVHRWHMNIADTWISLTHEHSVRSRSVVVCKIYVLLSLCRKTISGCKILERGYRLKITRTWFVYAVEQEVTQWSNLRACHILQSMLHVSVCMPPLEM